MQHPEGTHAATTYVGIDVSKGHLDAFHRTRRGWEERTRKRRFANSPKGHRALIAWIGTGPARVCLEASGRYSIDIALALCEAAGLEAMMANPRATKQFGDASMRRSKTDRLDAELLCDYAERMPFAAWEPPEAVLVELRAITRRIQALTVERSREKNRLHAEEVSRTASHVVTNDIEVNIRHLTRRIDELTRQALGLLGESGRLRSAFEHLVSIRGVGQKSAILLLGELGMLPADMSVREWVAFAGLDPRRHASGTSVERREQTREGRQRPHPPCALHAGLRGGAARAAGEGVLREAHRQGEEAAPSSPWR